MRGFIEIDTYCGMQLISLRSIERVQKFGESECEVILTNTDYQLDDFDQRYYAQNRLVSKESYTSVLRKIRRAAL